MCRVYLFIAVHSMTNTRSLINFWWRVLMRSRWISGLSRTREGSPVCGPNCKEMRSCDNSLLNVWAPGTSESHRLVPPKLGETGPPAAKPIVRIALPEEDHTPAGLVGVLHFFSIIKPVL